MHIDNNLIYHEDNILLLIDNDTFEPVKKFVGHQFPIYQDIRQRLRQGRCITDSLVYTLRYDFNFFTGTLTSDYGTYTKTENFSFHVSNQDLEAIIENTYAVHPDISNEELLNAFLVRYMDTCEKLAYLMHTYPEQKPGTRLKEYKQRLEHAQQYDDVKDINTLAGYIYILFYTNS